ncbi:transposase [Cupriavidus basilensis]|uniref:Transposase n=1 Tax=Cupriavidus basilensis TaxID=68895 RepID=A0A0C4YFG8_9BURK|nr:transposase [Cupriavidus basilensis]
MKRRICLAEAENRGKKRLIAVVEPYYAKSHRGRQPIGLARMLRVWFLQQWYGLSAEALQDTLHDSMAKRVLAGDELTRQLIDEIGIMLRVRGLIMKEGMIVDATIVDGATVDQDHLSLC